MGKGFGTRNTWIPKAVPSLNPHNKEPPSGQQPGDILILPPNPRFLFKIALRQRPMEAINCRLGKFSEMCC